MTDMQRFIQRRARTMAHLYCAHCNERAPRFSGGACPRCERGRAPADDRARGRPIAAVRTKLYRLTATVLGSNR